MFIGHGADELELAGEECGCSCSGDDEIGQRLERIGRVGRVGRPDLSYFQRFNLNKSPGTISWPQSL